MEYLARLLLAVVVAAVVLSLLLLLPRPPWAPLADAATPAADLCCCPPELPLLPLLKWYKAALEDIVAGSCGFLKRNLMAGEFLLKAPEVGVVGEVGLAFGFGGLVAKWAGAVRCPLFGGVGW